MIMDSRFEPTIVLPGDLFPNAFEASEHAFADKSLSVQNATWFLELLEKSNMEELSPETRSRLEQANLRGKPKHRTAILFEDDANFVGCAKHELRIDDAARARCAELSLDPRVWLVREACKDVIEAYKLSITNAPLRSCVWSALMHRAEFHLKMSGVSDVFIMENSTNKEAMLCVQGHQVSRSNFTKIARAFCEGWKTPK